ncbi:MAG: DUF1893 domain-containing protein [Nitrososphaeria archaeon]
MLSSNDLSVARSLFIEKKLSFVIVKDGEVLAETKEQGIRALIETVFKDSRRLQGASLADKVVGKAVMLLAIKVNITSIYANVISIPALELAAKFPVSVVYDKAVKAILNRRRDDICSFEKIVKDIDNPEEAFKALKNYQIGGNIS